MTVGTGPEATTLRCTQAALCSNDNHLLSIGSCPPLRHRQSTGYGCRDYFRATAAGSFDTPRLRHAKHRLLETSGAPPVARPSSFRCNLPTAGSVFAIPSPISVNPLLTPSGSLSPFHPPVCNPGLAGRPLTTLLRSTRTALSHSLALPLLTVRQCITFPYLVPT